MSSASPTSQSLHLIHLASRPCTKYSFKGKLYLTLPLGTKNPLQFLLAYFFIKFVMHISQVYASYNVTELCVIQKQNTYIIINGTLWSFPSSQSAVRRSIEQWFVVAGGCYTVRHSFASNSAVYCIDSTHSPDFKSPPFKLTVLTQIVVGGNVLFLSLFFYLTKAQLNKS